MGEAAEDDDDGDEAMSCAGADDAGEDVALATGIARDYDGVLARLLGQGKDDEAVMLRREIAAMCTAFGKQRQAAGGFEKVGANGKIPVKK